MSQTRGEGGQRGQSEEKQREQQRQQYQQQAERDTQLSPPPYEVPETTLERLGPGFAYMAAWVGGATLLNLVVLGIIASQAGG